MSPNVVTLIVNPKDAGGNPVTQGSAIIVPTKILTDVTDHILATQVPISVAFNSFAPPQVELYGTDDSQFGQTGWGYMITFFGFPGAPQPYSFTLPFANGATQYLSDVSEIFDPSTMQAYLPLPTGTPQAGQVPVATGNGEFSTWGSPFISLAAATGLNGFALQNATPNILSWTAPNDGNVHRVMVIAQLVVSSTETGGQVNINFTDPGNTSRSRTVFNPSQGAGFASPVTGAVSWLIAPGSTVTLAQNTALIAGASIVWAELWAS